MAGERPKTEGLPNQLVALASDCWNEDPNLRPTFTEIVNRLPRLKNLVLPPQVINLALKRLSTNISTSSSLKKSAEKVDLNANDENTKIEIEEFR